MEVNPDGKPEPLIWPFAASAGWWRIYVGELAAGFTPEEASARACRLTHTAGKDFARATISGDVRLAVPVEGGAHLLKRGYDLPLSDHGKWRREHLGAWQAAYGRTPFSEHLMPRIAAVYRLSEEQPMTLGRFNRELAQVAESWLTADGVLADIAAQQERLAPVFDSTIVKVNTERSIFDAIFRLGKETIFGIFHP